MDRLFKSSWAFLILLALVPFPANALAQNGPTQGPTQPLNNDSIVKLVKAGLGEDTIISIVRTQPGKYSLGADDIIALKEAGVSEKTITTMAAATTKGTASALPAAAAPTGNGRIKGTLTFFFNENFGSKPDVGAQIVLIRGFLDPIPDEAYAVFVPTMLLVGTEEKVMHVTVADTVADGNGNFEIVDVPPGQYTIVMKSSHAKGKFVGVVVTTDKKGKPLKKPRTEHHLNKRDILGVVFSSPVTVEPGRTANVSHDFGTSAI
jgi:hypothetical protein